MRIVMLGAPGSGKGTQAKRLEAGFGLVQISTGDLLRSAVAAGSVLGQRAKEIMDAGELVPDEIVLGLIKERLVSPEAANGFVLDGYPRNASQAEDLEHLLDELGLSLDAAVLMDLDFDILFKRLTGRRTCSTTGKLLNIYFSSKEELEECIKGGGDLLQRDDDNEDTIRNRLLVYDQKTAPLVDYYSERGLLSRIDAEGAVDDVHRRLRDVLAL